MKHRLLGILGAAPSQVPLIFQAATAGIPTVVIDPLPQRPGHLFATGSSAYVDLRDKAAVADVCIELGVAGVGTAGSDIALEALAHVTQALGLPNGVPLAALQTSRNKIAQRRVLQRLKAPSPWFAPGDQYAQCAARLQAGNALVVKPVDLWGSLGVTVVTPPGQGALHLRKAIADARRLSPTRNVIVEDFLDGPEYVLDIRSRDGIVTSLRAAHKLKMDGRRAQGGVPAFWTDASGLSLGPAWTSDIWSTVQAVVSELSPSWSGFINLNCIVGASQAMILEFGYRMGGNWNGAICDIHLGSDHGLQLLADCLPDLAFSMRNAKSGFLSNVDSPHAYRPVSMAYDARVAARILGRLPDVLPRDAPFQIDRVLGDVPGEGADSGSFPSVGGCLVIWRFPKHWDYERIGEALRGIDPS